MNNKPYHVKHKSTDNRNGRGNRQKPPQTTMKNKEITFKLINEAINETLATHANNADTLNSAAWGWREFDESIDSYVVGPNNIKCFHSADKVIKILEGTGVHWFLTIMNNATGEPAACIQFF